VHNVVSKCHKVLQICIVFFFRNGQHVAKYKGEKNNSSLCAARTSTCSAGCSAAVADIKVSGVLKHGKKISGNNYVYIRWECYKP
jgi:hypothetical protein